MANTREMDAARFLRKNGPSKLSVVAEGIGCTKRAAQRALIRLSLKGLAETKGQSHAARWSLTTGEMPTDGRGKHGNWNRSPENLLRVMRNLRHVCKQGVYVPRAKATGLAACWGWGVERTVQAAQGKGGIQAQCQS